MGIDIDGGELRTSLMSTDPFNFPGIPSAPPPSVEPTTCIEIGISRDRIFPVIGISRDWTEILSCDEPDSSELLDVS